VDDLTWLSWIDRGKTIAAFLVAIGVAAEFAFGWVEGPILKRIDAAKDERIAAANGIAAEAQRGAAEAQARAADANKLAAEANALAEKEKLARVKIEKSLAPRTLTFKQRAAIAAALKPFSGCTLEVFLQANDLEATALLNSIVESVQHAGWIVNTIGGQEGGRTIGGIWIEINATAAPQVVAAARSLSIVLEKQDIGVVTGPNVAEYGRYSTMLTAGVRNPKSEIRMIIAHKLTAETMPP